MCYYEQKLNIHKNCRMKKKHYFKMSTTDDAYVNHVPETNESRII